MTHKKGHKKGLPAIEFFDVGHVRHPGPGHDHLLGEPDHVADAADQELPEAMQALPANCKLTSPKKTYARISSAAAPRQPSKALHHARIMCTNFTADAFFGR